MFDGAPQTNPAILMIDEVIRINGRLRSIFAGVNAATGLAPMESTVLTAVVQSRAPPTVPQIGRSLGHPRQVIQRAANALIGAGLIETAANPHHKRAPLLLATPAGLERKHQADAHASQAANALLEALGEDRCDRLTRDLRDMRTDIEAHLRARKG